MATSWYEKAKEFKSPSHVVSAFLLRSRETQAANNRRLGEEIKGLNVRPMQAARASAFQKRLHESISMLTTALLKPNTPEGVSEAFGRVSAKDVKAWVKRHFGSTVTSRRQAAYAEHKATLKSATVQYATT